MAAKVYTDPDNGLYMIDENGSKVYQRQNLIEFRKLDALNYYYRGHHIYCNYATGPLETCINCGPWLKTLRNWTDHKDPNEIYDCINTMLHSFEMEFKKELMRPSISIMVLREWVYKIIEPYKNESLEFVENNLIDDIKEQMVKWISINQI